MTSESPKHWLLLRGLGREHRHWFSFPEQLAQSLRVECHTLDLAGMGTESQRQTPTSIEGIATDLARRVSTLRGDDLRPWGILGISLGGMIAMCLCEHYPSWFSHLVLVNSSSRLSPPLERLKPVAVLRLMRALRIEDSVQREAALYRLTTRLNHRLALEYATVSASIFDSNPIRVEPVLRQIVAAGAYQVPDELIQEILVMSSLGDEMVSPDCSRRLAMHWRSEHVQHPTAGHDLPLEEPVWVGEKIRAWLEAAPRGRGPSSKDH